MNMQMLINGNHGVRQHLAVSRDSSSDFLSFSSCCTTNSPNTEHKATFIHVYLLISELFFCSLFSPSHWCWHEICFSIHSSQQHESIDTLSPPRTRLFGPRSIVEDNKGRIKFIAAFNCRGLPGDELIIAPLQVSGVFPLKDFSAVVLISKCYEEVLIKLILVTCVWSNDSSIQNLLLN